MYALHVDSTCHANLHSRLPQSRVGPGGAADQPGPEGFTVTLPPPISTVGEFLQCLEPMTRGAAPDSFLYRGQADSDWDVNCSAVRRLATNRADTQQAPAHPAVVSYLDSLLREAAQHVGKWADLPGGFSQLQILAQLQHFGAATPLIDFTLNPFVALWFASNDRLDRDGAVYTLSRRDLREIDESDVGAKDIISYFYPETTVSSNER